MASEMGTIEDRLKSFTAQLQTECSILERLVYKHKNQHRRCSYFQYILKVRRDMKLLKSSSLEDVLDSAFIVINGNRPKQKVQLLESLKRRKCSGGKYNFLERLLGVSRLLSQIVEPLLKAAMEISPLLAKSFFMKFSMTTLAVLARIRVLVQQMLLDVVLLYNTVVSLSHREQTVKLNQEGFEVFREYYPGKEKDAITLECVWQNDKYVLVEKTYENEMNSQEKDEQAEDVLLNPSNIQYENVEVLLGVEESSVEGAKSGSTDQINSHTQIADTDAGHSNDEKKVGGPSDRAGASCAPIIPPEDGFTSSLILETDSKKLSGSIISAPSFGFKFKSETRKRVAFVAVKPPTPTPTPTPSL